MESHLQINLVRPSLQHKWGLQLSYDYTRKVIKVATVVENSILRSQLRVNDVLVKLNGVDPTLKFRDVKGLYAFMSKALNMTLTIKRPFSNEGKDKMPISAETIESAHSLSETVLSYTPSSSSSLRYKRRRNDEFPEYDYEDDDDVVKINTSEDNLKSKSLELAHINEFDQNCAGDDDDVKFVGGDVDTALFNMPHHREHCPLYLFQSLHQQIQQGKAKDEDIASEVRKNNMTICKYCYCHVCQVKASECTKWEKHCLHSLKVNFVNRQESGQRATMEAIVDITSDT